MRPIPKTAPGTARGCTNRTLCMFRHVSFSSAMRIREHLRFVNGRGWDRTSDLPRVKRALSR
jgi:hypothetical protein